MATLNEILEARRRNLEARKRNTPIEAVRAGLDAVSLFADETVYDGGRDDLMFLVRAMQPLNIPVIAEDYVLDEYQIVEARAAGVSGIVLDGPLLNPHLIAQVRAELSAGEP